MKYLILIIRFIILTTRIKNLEFEEVIKMRKKRLKHHSNLVCRITGWHDRIFRLVALNYDGMVTSSFWEGRRQIFVNEASEAVDKAQSRVVNARTKSDEIMAQITENDIGLITKGASNINEERRRKKIFRLFEELIVIRNEIRATHVSLHSDLDDTQSQVKRELTAYIMAAFSRKKAVDIKRNSIIDYKDMITYHTYLSTYEYADKCFHNHMHLQKFQQH